MAARVGVTREQVVDVAVALLDETDRPERVSLAAVASELGIRTQSLYAHVDGAAGLRRALALRALAELAQAVTAAAVGRAGADAASAIVRAHASYALARPGRYAAAIVPPHDDVELGDAIDGVAGPLLTVLASCGLDEADGIHWMRTALAAVYGLALLDRDGQLTLGPPAAETVDHIIHALVARLEPT